MAKLVLTNLISLANDTSAVNTINNNMALIIQAIDKALFRTGELPHVMLADLDLGSNFILNLRPPNNPTDGATKKYVDDLLSGTEDVGAALLRADLADTSTGQGASLIGLEDPFGWYLSTTVEGALDELPSMLGSNITGNGASMIGVEDPTSNFTATEVEGVVKEIHDRGRTNVWSGVVTLGTDTYTASLSPALLVLPSLASFNVYFSTTSTVANPTLDLDGIGPKNLIRADGSSLFVGDISGYHNVIYDGVSFRVMNTAVVPSSTFRGALVNMAASVMIPTGAVSTLSWDQETYDTDNIHDIALNNDRLVVPAGVTYVRITADLTFASFSPGLVTLSILSNINAGSFSTNVAQESPLAASATLSLVSAIMPVVAGEYFTITAQQFSGGNLNVGGPIGFAQASMEIIA